MAAETFAWLLVVIHILGGIINWVQAERGGKVRYEPPATLRMAAILSFTLAFMCWFYFT